MQIAQRLPVKPLTIYKMLLDCQEQSKNPRQVSGPLPRHAFARRRCGLRGTAFPVVLPEFQLYFTGRTNTAFS
jgi:hypothetical protein